MPGDRVGFGTVKGMADNDQTALQRRATWVGLKTLRQRPRVVGETGSGEPVFEVRSVRLVLRDEAGHFSRLAECSKCGREVPGAPVMGPADLDRPAHSVICKDCVRASVAARPLQPEWRAAKSERPAPPVQKADEQPSGPPDPVDDVRLAAVEVQLQAAVARLAELADLQRMESAESRLQEALRQGLAQIRAEVVASSQRSETEQAAANDEDRKRAEALAQVVQAQQSRLASMSAMLTEIRDDVLRLAESNQELARAQRDLERRIEERVGKADASVAALEKRLRGDVTTLAQAVETVRGDLEGSLGAPLGTGMAMVVQAVQELARGRDEIKASVGGRVEALTSAVEDGSSRVRALERRTEESIERLTEALEDQRRELKEVTATHRLDYGIDGGTLGRSAAGELLDGLERQLQEAEGRLARLTAGPGEPVVTPADGSQGRNA